MRMTIDPLVGDSEPLGYLREAVSLGSEFDKLGLEIDLPGLNAVR